MVHLSSSSSSTSSYNDIIEHSLKLGLVPIGVSQSSIGNTWAELEFSSSVSNIFEVWTILKSAQLRKRMRLTKPRRLRNKQSVSNSWRTEWYQHSEEAHFARQQMASRDGCWPIFTGHERCVLATLAVLLLAKQTDWPLHGDTPSWLFYLLIKLSGVIPPIYGHRTPQSANPIHTYISNTAYACMYSWIAIISKLTVRV